MAPATCSIASGWTVTTDSAELTGENGAASNAIDGNPATIWHTQWQSANPLPPHWLQIDLGASYTVGGMKYLPRQDASANGTFGPVPRLAEQ